MWRILVWMRRCASVFLIFMLDIALMILTCSFHIDQGFKALENLVCESAGNSSRTSSVWYDAKYWRGGLSLFITFIFVLLKFSVFIYSTKHYCLNENEDIDLRCQNGIQLHFITCSISWNISGLTLARRLSFHRFWWLPYSGIRSVNLRSTGSRGFSSPSFQWDSFPDIDFAAWTNDSNIDAHPFVTYTYSIANRHDFFIYRLASYTILIRPNSFLYFYLCYPPSSSTINFTPVIWRDQELIGSCHPVAHGTGMGIPTLGCSQPTSNLDVVDASLR